MSYFFLGSVLPPLELGSRPEMLFEHLLTLFKENMTQSDYGKVEKILSFIDLKNVKALLQKEPLDPRGNLTEKELDEALVTREGFPEYLYEHLEKYERVSDQIAHFSYVFAKFFQEMAEKERGFLSFYFNFEREWRLLMVGLRSKHLNRELAVELQYEDFHDPLVAYLLAQKDSPQFELPVEYQDLDKQILQEGKNPLDQYRNLAHFRLNRLAEEVQDDPFSLDYALSYFIQLMLVEDWNQLNERKGSQKLNGIVKEEVEVG